jgi:hypothetical protein
LKIRHFLYVHTQLHQESPGFWPRLMSSLRCGRRHRPAALVQRPAAVAAPAVGEVVRGGVMLEGWDDGYIYIILYILLYYILYIYILYIYIYYIILYYILYIIILYIYIVLLYIYILYYIIYIYIRLYLSNDEVIVVVI